MNNTTNRDNSRKKMTMNTWTRRVALGALIVLNLTLNTQAAEPPRDVLAADRETLVGQPADCLLIASSIPGTAVAQQPSPPSQPAKQKKPVAPPSYVPLLDAALRGPMAGVEDIVFAVRKSVFGHWYANFGHESRGGTIRKNGEIDYGRVPIQGGGGLFRLNLRTKQVTPLLKVVTGRVRDPQVHYDGKKILFSYLKDGSEFFNLYEINADGTALRQLTDGPFDDIEPTYLPDGNIIFISSRCKRFVPCWRTQVATVHRCDGNGGNIRPLSSNVEHDNTPWMLPDGRLIYTRWEYVDRDQTKFHHLWTMNPDGSGQMVYYGNSNPGTAMLDAKPIPGTDKVVASFSGGHGATEHAGDVTIVDQKAGPDDRRRVKRIREGGRDPYPFSEDCFLVCDNTRILLINGNGAADMIYENPDGIDVHEPRPLTSRPREPVLADRVDMGKETGTIYLADILHGRNMEGVRPGEIEKLLVLESLPKPINFADWMDTISYMSTFTLSRVLGTIPVEADGSAYAEMPAMRSLFFVALDKNNMSVKRMQSFFTVQPGETVGCAGCHEKRTQTPRIGSMPLALM
ncbi:MAG: hypothetical protein ABR915_00005, partial [Thermoguttaceae bacterium]